MTPFGQLSTQVRHRIHSELDMSLFVTIELTSRLIGQFLLHLLQSMHWNLSALSRSEGNFSLSLAFVPIIMNGAIQQP